MKKIGFAGAGNQKRPGLAAMNSSRGIPAPIGVVGKLYHLLKTCSGKRLDVVEAANPDPVLYHSSRQVVVEALPVRIRGHCGQLPGCRVAQY